MLACEMKTAECPRPRMRAGSSSRPTRNMKKTMPYSLSTFRYGSAPGGKRAADTPGASQPSSDGPRRMPPITSPTTCGWPSARRTPPSTRATARMTNISSVMTLSRRSAGIGAGRRGGGRRPGGAGGAGRPPPRSRGRRGAAPGLALGPPLRGADPPPAALDPLPLPDRDDRLQLVDEPAAGRERLAAMSRRDRDRDARLPDRDPPDAVDHGDAPERPAARRLCGERAHLPPPHARERPVPEAHDMAAGVLVPRRAEERDDRARGGIAHRAKQAVEHDRRASDAEHGLRASADGRKHRQLVTLVEPVRRRHVGRVHREAHRHAGELRA